MLHDYLTVSILLVLINDHLIRIAFLLLSGALLYSLICLELCLCHLVVSDLGNHLCGGWSLCTFSVSTKLGGHTRKELLVIVGPRHIRIIVKLNSGEDQ